jgi:hypothetical protein
MRIKQVLNQPRPNAGRQSSSFNKHRRGEKKRRKERNKQRRNIEKIKNKNKTIINGPIPFHPSPGHILRGSQSGSLRSLAWPFSLHTTRQTKSHQKRQKKEKKETSTTTTSPLVQGNHHTNQEAKDYLLTCIWSSHCTAISIASYLRPPRSFPSLTLTDRSCKLLGDKTRGGVRIASRSPTEAQKAKNQNNNRHLVGTLYIYSNRFPRNRPCHGGHSHV